MGYQKESEREQVEAAFAELMLEIGGVVREKLPDGHAFVLAIGRTMSSGSGTALLSNMPPEMGLQMVADAVRQHRDGRSLDMNI